MSRLNTLLKESPKKRLKLNNEDKEWIDAPEAGKETLKTFRTTDQKRDLKRAKNAKDMFEKLGI